MEINYSTEVWCFKVFSGNDWSGLVNVATLDFLGAIPTKFEH